MELKEESSSIPEGMQLIDFGVTGCTSESERYKANNILYDDTKRYWQTLEPTDLASIEIQFPSPTLIKSIDIGNAGSAFISIEVGLVNWEVSEYQPMLKDLGNFMNYSESKNRTNRFRVKRFEGSQYFNECASSKWEKVRIICHQQFVKDNIGISFIKFYTPDPTIKRTRSNLSNQKSSSNLSNNDVTTTPLKSKVVEEDTTTTSVSDFKSDKTLDLSTMLNNKEPQQQQQRKSSSGISSEKTIMLGGATSPFKKQVSRASSILSNPLPGEVYVVEKKQPSIGPEDTTSTTTTTTSTAKTINEPMMEEDTDEEDFIPQTLPPEKKKDVPSFNQLLKGVVFVIGGMVNPHKSLLRDKALEMGAESSHDWFKNKTTHLITPISGTPKFNLVKKENGTIVHPKWIEDCYKEKCRLPIKKYIVVEKKRDDAEDDDGGDQKKKKKSTSDKVGKSISTEEKKKKKKKGSKKGNDDSDEEEDENEPNEYDLNDEFIDTHDYDEEEFPQFDLSDEEFVNEDVNDLMKDGIGYLKRTYDNYRGVDYLLKKNNHSENNGHTQKKHKSNNYYNDNNNKNSSSREDKKDHQQQQKQQHSKLTLKPSILVPKKKEEKEQELFDQDLLFDDHEETENNITQELSPEEVDKEINKILSKVTSPLNNGIELKQKNEEIDVPISNECDTDEDDDKKPEKYIVKSVKDLRGKECMNSPNQNILDPLPSFFEGIEYYLSIKNEDTRKQLIRYITAYKGSISNMPTVNTKYIITDKTTWDKLFDITKTKFPKVLFLKPNFIINCHENQKLVSLDNQLHVISK
eukprot:gene970-1235_t